MLLGCRGSAPVTLLTGGAACRYALADYTKHVGPQTERKQLHCFHSWWTYAGHMLLYMPGAMTEALAN